MIEMPLAVVGVPIALGLLIAIASALGLGKSWMEGRHEMKMFGKKAGLEKLTLDAAAMMEQESQARKQQMLLQNLQVLGRLKGDERAFEAQRGEAGIKAGLEDRRLALLMSMVQQSQGAMGSALGAAQEGFAGPMSLYLTRR